MDEAAERERTLTAFHEAGHVVAYLARGHAFRYVTIRPRNAAYAGMVAVRRPRSMRVEDFVEIAYAGSWAEARYQWPGPDSGLIDFDVEDGAGLTFPDYFMGTLAFGGGRCDLEASLEAERQASAGMARDWDAHMYYRLAHRWTDIERVAQALLTSPRALTMRQVLAITSFGLTEED